MYGVGINGACTIPKSWNGWLCMLYVWKSFGFGT